MTESKQYTFKSLFESKFTSKDYDNEDGIKLTEIEIPIIQRDYAQGRKSTEVWKVRSSFLDALYDGLVGQHSIGLDFVYGDITSRGKLIPLDGQQRLTTLFLLHWYVAKREGIDKTEYEFLNHFTYETRDSARLFFHQLIDFCPDFDAEKLSEGIENQNWFPYEWKKDPTIVSALVMIDAIHAKFGPAICHIKRDSNDEDGLWKRLDEGLVSFYFLPIHEMGLTDDLYIKMNSRGKPLTMFEHFKAALEHQLEKKDRDTANRIIRKIDLEWTDMLWSYRGTNNIIDDEFMAYFTFITNIIYYRLGKSPKQDPFDIIDDLFDVNNPKCAYNITYLEKMFDIWCDVGDISEYFKGIYTRGFHEENKIAIFFPINNERGEVNPFLECCWNFGVLNGLGNRTFTLNKFLWLYAVTVGLINKDKISRDISIQRLRIVNNLINASEFEIRENNMANILSHIDLIMVNGEIDQNRQSVSFSKMQLNEEQRKLDYLKNNMDDRSRIYKLEDHPLLRGTISVIGLDRLDLCDKFYELFDATVDRQNVNAAMLSIGDYSQLFRWRYQFGARADVSWMNLFHPSNDRKGFDQTRTVLRTLLDKMDVINNETLASLTGDYIEKQTAYDWRYYMVKYSQMRTEAYGMYYWEDNAVTGKQYDFIMMHTEKSIGGRNWYAFLKVLYALCNNGSDDLIISDYAYNNSEDGKYLIETIDDRVSKILMTQTGYEIYNDDNSHIGSVNIRQNADGYDIEDRILIGQNLIEKLRKKDMNL